MKYGLFILLFIPVISYSQAELGFTETMIEGKVYYIANIPCRTFSSFIRTSHRYNLGDITESVSDTGEILLAEKILKEDLSRYMVQKLDSNAQYDRTDLSVYQKTYELIRNYGSQVRTF